MLTPSTLLSILQAGQVRVLWLQKELIPTCRELGIGMLAYSPMGRGILSGAFKPEELPADDFRTKVPDTYYSKENLEVVGPCSRSSHDDWLNQLFHVDALCSIHMHQNSKLQVGYADDPILAGNVQDDASQCR